MSVTSEVLNKDIEAALSDSNSDIGATLNTGRASDTTDLVASDDKIFNTIANVPSSQPKAFSVHETKQSVSEINFSPTVPENTKVGLARPADITNLSNKSGIDVVNDGDLISAQTEVTNKLADIKSASASTSADEMAALKAPTLEAEVIEDTRPITTGDPVNDALIPDGMSLDEFNEIQSTFSDSDSLTGLNICPDFGNLFALPAWHLPDFPDFFDLGLSFPKLFDCLPGGFNLMDTVDKQGLIGKALKTGNLGAVEAALNTVSDGLVKNTTGGAFDVLNNYTGDLSDSTDSDLADTVLGQLGVDKTKLLNTGSGERDLNSSITDELGDVFSTDKAADALRSENGLGSYSVGDSVSSLLGNIPAFN